MCVHWLRAGGVHHVSWGEGREGRRSHPQEAQPPSKGSWEIGLPQHRREGGEPSYQSLSAKEQTRLAPAGMPLASTLTFQYQTARMAPMLGWSSPVTAAPSAPLPPSFPTHLGQGWAAAFPKRKESWLELVRNRPQAPQLF